MGDGALSILLAGQVYDYLSFYRPPPRRALAPFTESHDSLPTSPFNSPSLAHVCGDVALSYLDGFAQRMLLSKKEHHSANHEGLSNIYSDPLLGHNDQVYADFVSSLVKSGGSFTFLLVSTCQSGLFCVCTKNLPVPAFNFGRQTDIKDNGISH